MPVSGFVQYPEGDSIFNGKITISEADKQQSNLLKAILQFKKAILQFNDKVRPRSKADKDKKQILMKV